MEEFEPNIIGFLCNWCSYAGADLAGTSRIQYPTNIRIIRVMCSGRINPMFVVNALQQGADGVLIGGCHPGDCHYQLLKKYLKEMGVNPNRVRFEFVSASEGHRFAEVVREFVEELKKIGPISLQITP